MSNTIIRSQNDPWTPPQLLGFKPYISLRQPNFWILVVFMELLLQEDVPEEFAGRILNFVSHNRIGPNGVEVSNLRHYLPKAISFS